MPRPRKFLDPHDRILDAAERLLATHGYARMTVESLARAAGMGKGTVYLFFERKEEVALAAIDRLVKRLLVRLDEIARDSSPAPRRLREMLRLRVLHRFDAARAHSKSVDAMLAAFREALLERRREHFRLESERFERVLRDGIREGSLRRLPVKRAASALVEATNALLPYSLSVRELGARAAVAARAAAVADLVLQGVLFRSGAASRGAGPQPRRSVR